MIREGKAFMDDTPREAMQDERLKQVDSKYRCVTVQHAVVINALLFTVASFMMLFKSKQHAMLHWGLMIKHNSAHSDPGLNSG